MTNAYPQDNNQQVCPKCSSPLEPGKKFCETCGTKVETARLCTKCGEPLSMAIKFCETCGTKVEAVRLCTKCGEPLSTSIKFCEICGTPVDPAPVTVQPAAPPAAAPEPVEVKTPAPQPEPVVAAIEKTPDKKTPEKPKETVQKTPEKAPEPVEVKTPAPQPEPEAAAIEKTPDKKTPEKPKKTVQKTPEKAPAPIEVKKPEPPPEPATAAIEKTPDKKTPERQKETAQKTPDKAPASQTRMLIIAGVVGLIIVAALAFFVLLPMLSGSGTASGGATPLPTTAVSATPSQGSATAQSSASASFVPEPTQIPPTNLLVTYQAERDPITGVVTVTFTGGQGSAVRDVLIRLTLADGQVVMKTFKPTQIGSLDTLQGTTNSKGSDRIEVIANYYNGDKYRIIDKLFEYKKKF